ncbi:ABC transporter ATP-binding protein [Aspergillus mulundensis]|uniref:Uncharacterized protein n=1 Tax=Aspergillus mulundensis TaxID=1810919 RepID=A0A3D8R0N5_9EURO|nr:hypothetical protein DSM5745_09337 [Aspergillus mulundensis]RDW67471.1 hypothetical protein DSM5745_09337 [Aspergillus mulundensis]
MGTSLELDKPKEQHPSCLAGLIQHSSKRDILLLLIGCLASIVSGVMMPLTTILIGSSIKIYASADETTNASDLTRHVNKRVVLLCAIAAGAVVAAYIQTVCWMLASQSISSRIRRAYFRSLLHQDVQSLDDMGVGKLTDTMSSSFTTLQDTLSQKTGVFISSVSTFVSAFIVALVRSWKLALILSTVLPAMFVVTMVISTQVAKNAQSATACILHAHDVVAESVSSVKVVRTLQAQDTLAEKYESSLHRADRALLKKSIWQAAIWTWVFFVRFGVYALALWEGARLFISDNLDMGVLINVLYAVIIGTIALSRVSRSLHEFGVAIGLANELFEMISRDKKGVMSMVQEKKHRSRIHGHVSFCGVHFAYSSRPAVPVLDGLDLTIESGQTTALIGHSGAGKSTIAGLIQQFYEPTAGDILIDGLPISSFDPSDLRSQISFLSQEPVFFSMSVLENVRLGLLGTPFESGTVTDQDKLIEEACELAGIAKVIESLPQGYNTLLGPDGVLLSGGEKQRLAFARAIVRDPRILILDEPTSALDKAAETHIQTVLERVSAGRTVIVIAHRLHTIKHADSIVVLSQGKVAEQGTHKELLQSGQLYRSLFALHQQGTGEDRALSPNSADLGTLRPTTPDVQEKPALGIENDSIECISMTAPGPERASIFVLLLRILRFNQPEWLLLLVGNVGSVISGSLYPFQALLFAKAIVLEQEATSQGDFQRSATRYAVFFFLIALVSGISHGASTFAFSVSFDRMLNRVRSLSFQGILGKGVTWFATDRNSSSSLVFLLLHQYRDLAGLHGVSVSILVEIITNMTAVTIFSVVISWKYALVVISVIPLIFVSYYFRIHTMRTFLRSITEWHRTSTQIACEAITSILTVTSLGAQGHFLNMYDSQLTKASESASLSTWRYSVFFAATQGLIYAVNAFAIWYGARCMEDNSITLYQFFAVFIALTFGAQDSGEALSLLPDLSLAIVAAERVKELSPYQEAKGSPSATSPASVLTTPSLTGHDSIEMEPKDDAITFDDVTFRHPNATAPSIQNLSVTLITGQTIAIVGPSGSGKSTILNLLAGLYTPTSGTITFRDQDIITQHSSISLVPQDSVLFTGTIKFNITLRNPSASDAQIEAACAQAGILNFILSLPAGFETIVRPQELSVGQRQRLTIARALVRDTEIVLFDEPTASLDVESASAIVAAIQTEKRERRKSIVMVAHSPELVMWADVACVVVGGRVVQMGSPGILIKDREGVFTRLMGTT